MLTYILIFIFYNKYINAEDSIANQLNGAGAVNVNKVVGLTGNNSNFSGKFTVADNSAITVSNLTALGTAGIGLSSNTASLNINNVGNDTFANVLTGSGSVNLDKSSIVLSGDNKDFSGTFKLVNTSLTVNSQNQIGRAGIILDAKSGILFNSFTGNLDDRLNNDITGAGYVQLSDTAFVLNDGKNFSGISGALSLTNGSVITATSVNQLNTGSIAINDVSELNVTQNGGITFNNALSGEGKLNVDGVTSTSNFVFGTEVGSNFKGTLALSNTTLDVNNSANTDPLLNATLSVKAGASTTTTEGNTSLGNLELSGGTVNIGFASAGQANILSVKEISEGTAGSTINIVRDDALSDTPITPAGAILDQANYDPATSSESIQLISAEAIAQSGQSAQFNLTLNGQELTNSVPQKIFDNANNELRATYQYQGVVSDTGTDKGVYLGYVLTEVDVSPSGKFVLTTEGSKADNHDFGAKITGTGDVTYIATDGRTLGITDPENDYIGNSTIQGAIEMNDDGVLGQTQTLNITKNSSLNMNGFSQTIQKLNNSGALNLANGGSLTINDGGVSTGGLMGEGDLKFVSGTTSISGNNAEFRANTTIQSEAIVTIDHITGLGQSSEIVADGKLNISGVSGTFENSLSGDGELIVSKNGNVALINNTEFNGLLNVNKGSSLAVHDLGESTSIQTDGDFTYDVAMMSPSNMVVRKLTDANKVTGTGNFNKAGVGLLILESDLEHQGKTNIQMGELRLSNTQITSKDDVTIASIATLSGMGKISGNVINYGLFNVGNPDASSSQRARIISNNTFTVDGDFSNRGTISLLSSGLDAELSIIGDYVGNNGLLNISTELNGDNSATQRLIVDGNVSGITTIAVKNVDGLGAETTNGIEIVTVGGVSENQAFRLDGTLVAGNYEYNLYKTGENWVLGTRGPNSIGDSNERPDSGLNAGLGDAAVSLLTPGLGNFSFRDRGNDARTTGEKANNVWMTADYRHTKGETASGQFTYKNNIKGMQIGADHTFATGDHWLTLGVMASMHHIDGKSYDRKESVRAKSDTDAYGFGVYGTWYLDETELSPYVDAYALYQNFKTTNKMSGDRNYKYHSHGMSFTAIGGYPIALDHKMVLEPQIQLGYVDYRSDTFRDHNDALAKTKLKGNFIGRVGAVLEFEKGSMIEPYIGASVWYDNTQVSTRYGDQFSLGNASPLKSNKAGAMFEAKLGFKAKPNKDLTLWGEVKGLTGKHSHRDYGAVIGIKYSF